MDSDGISTRPPTDPDIILFQDGQQPGVVESIIPLKRRLSVDSSSDANHSAQEGRRAYIAHIAPHLLENNGINGSHHLTSSPTSPASSLSHHNLSLSRSPSHSARPSPNGSDDEAGETSEAGANGSTTATKSRHVVPKRFRGPPPRLHDAELIAPVPTLIAVPGSDLYNTLNHPYTRNGYNYIAAGPATDELPTSVYRTLLTEPRGIHWSWSDRSSFTHISADATIISSDRGFRSARANVPVREGQWYIELHILPLDPTIDFAPQGVKDGPHVRLGWSRREAGLNAPVGINGYSYGVRDTTGEKVFLSRTYPYGTPFGPGDVVGMYISLPKARKVNAKDPMDPARINRKRIPIRYKGQLYFESMDYAVSKEMEHLMDRSRRGEKLREDQGREESVNTASGMLVQPVTEDTAAIAAKKKRKSAPGVLAASPSQNNTLRSMPTLGPDSVIGFFINGKAQGIAFENLLDFRPLRRQAAAVAGKSAVKANATSSLGLSQGDNDGTVITTSSSLANILKSRENHFDDGSLGYFPFVSLFGGAKVKIVSQADRFHYPPPANVREALEEADRAAGRAREGIVSPVNKTRCRAMEERFDEYLAELWRYDLADEEKAKANAHTMQANAEPDDDEDEETVVEVKPSSKSTSRKSKKRNTPSSRNDSPRMASTPLRDEYHINGHVAAQGEPGVKIEETEAEGTRSGITVKREEGEDTPMHDIPDEIPMQVDKE